MTGVIKVNELQGRSAVDNITVTDGSATMQLQRGLAKAVAQYFGQTNVLQSGSLNHSSITDDGEGLYDHNFTNNFANTVYIVIGESQRFITTSTLHNYGVQDGPTSAVLRTTSFCPMDSHYVNSGINRTNFDFDLNDFTAFGDLA